MHIKGNHIIKTWLSFGILAAMITLTANNSLYIHIHTSTDGNSIIHAHPYQKSDNGTQGNNHQHNGFELLALDTFQDFTPAGTVPVVNLFACDPIVILTAQTAVFLSNKIDIRFGRAPPFFI